MLLLQMIALVPSPPLPPRVAEVFPRTIPFLLSCPEVETAARDIRLGSVFIKDVVVVQRVASDEQAGVVIVSQSGSEAQRISIKSHVEQKPVQEPGTRG